MSNFWSLCHSRTTLYLQWLWWLWQLGPRSFQSTNIKIYPTELFMGAASRRKKKELWLFLISACSGFQNLSALKNMTAGMVIERSFNIWSPFKYSTTFQIFQDYHLPEQDWHSTLLNPCQELGLSVSSFRFLSCFTSMPLRSSDVLHAKTAYLWNSVWIVFHDSKSSSKVLSILLVDFSCIPYSLCLWSLFRHKGL